MENLQKSLDYIEENLAAELTAGELAERAGYSVSHYSHLFRETTGMSLGQYILRRRPDIIGHFDLLTKYDEMVEPIFLDKEGYYEIAEKYLEKVGR